MSLFLVLLVILVCLGFSCYRRYVRLWEFFVFWEKVFSFLGFSGGFVCFSVLFFWGFGF